MNTQSAKQHAAELLSMAGITLNGSASWDIQVHNDQFYNRVLAGGSLALGETYMEKWWDSTSLDEFFFRLLSSDLENIVKKSPKLIVDILLSKVLNFQTRSRAVDNIQMHYDMGNDLFSKVLDKSMAYTCGYWKNASTVDEAQENKVDLACRKLRLEPGMHVLDLGCGWGNFAKFAAEKYGVRVTGISISEEQIRYCNQLCEGLPVEIKLLDYRDLNQKFDHIVSFGMLEHIGHKNHRAFMEVASRCLKGDGLFLLQNIGNPVTRTYPDPWLNKYIFPNCTIPTIAQIGKAIDGLFVTEDLHNFGPDYDKTLMAWYHNFITNWPELKDKYDERFYRMWTYYLLSSAGGFRAKRCFLWQTVFSKRSRLIEYVAVR